jgi:hypothetical protein
MQKQSVVILDYLPVPAFFNALLIKRPPVTGGLFINHIPMVFF